MVSLISAGLVVPKTPSISLSKSAVQSHKSPPLITFGEFKRPNFVKRVNFKRAIRASSTDGSPGLYSAKQFELTVKNVDLVLEDVRPYLISDGGNVDVVSVEDGVILLQLQGACESCPSSTTTMKMGIERVLKEKFGDAVKDIREINEEQVNKTTVETVNRHLDILRPAIKNYGGKVNVIAIEGGECTVSYEGPETIASGIKAAIKEKFPDVVNVVFTN